VADTPVTDERVGLITIARAWTRIGCTGFGGPPAHIALLRRLCVADRKWLTAEEFEQGIAVCNLLPGPASTQLAILCSWKLRGTLGALVGGVCFIVPGLVAILALSVLFLAGHPPLWVRGAAAGAGAAVPAVAVHAAASLLPASWSRIAGDRAAQRRWLVYFVAGVVASALLGPFLVLVLLACGVAEAAARRAWRPPAGGLGVLWPLGVVPAGVASVAAAGGLGALTWVALRVGALSYGGGFVIIPLMQHDAVHTYHWMTGVQFVDAVALGQMTPGPVVQTIAVVGYAAAGVGGGLLAALVAFAPSFGFVLLAAPRLERLRASSAVNGFLGGAGPAALGAIAGSGISLTRALAHGWQFGVTAAALVWLLGLRRGVVVALVGAGVLGVVAVLVGAPV
jgi:chromate transporter